MPEKKETLKTRVKRVETRHQDLAAQVKRIHADLAQQIKADRAEWERRTKIDRAEWERRTKIDRAEWERRTRETDRKVKILLDSQIRTDEILRTIGEKLDERIGKLVSAIGQLISRMPPAGPR
jgi:transposase